METDLFKQLDLAIYAQAHLAWWQQPVVQILLSILLGFFVIGVIVIMRRNRKAKKQDFYVQQLLNILYNSVHLWEQEKLKMPELVLLLTAIVKQYTGFCMQNNDVIGMTDQEWLSFVQAHIIFTPVRDECAELVNKLSNYKFHQAIQGAGDVFRLCELVYVIIAKTAPGAVALTSGLCFNIPKNAAA